MAIFRSLPGNSILTLGLQHLHFYHRPKLAQRAKINFNVKLKQLCFSLARRAGALANIQRAFSSVQCHCPSLKAASGQKCA